MLFTIVCLQVDFMYYKHLLRMIGIGSCPVNVDNSMFCLVCVRRTFTQTHIL